MAQTIAITGKGGVGKTLMAALIIRHLKETISGAVLALDADPDCNLGSILGVAVETTIGDLREDLLKNIKDFPPGMSKENYIQMGLHEIIVETPKVDLITMGRGEGSGCYCFINHVLRGFADGLTPSYEWTVIDNEAGLEHLSRHTLTRIDHLIVVVNENPLAIECARRIDGLIDELDREVVCRHFLINAVRPERVETVKERMAGVQLQCLGAVPFDETVEDAVFHGRSVYSINSGPAVDAVHEVMQRIGAS